MSQNGQTYFKNLAAFAIRLLKCVGDHFGTLSSIGLNDGEIIANLILLSKTDF